MFKSVLVSCVLMLLVSLTSGQRCSGGAECILLSDCTVLNDQLLRVGATQQLTNLLRKLHCGFEGPTSLPKFINTGLSSVQKRSAQRVQQPKVYKNNNQRFAPYPVEPNIFDLAFWGIPTVKPARKPTFKPTTKPKLKPTVKATVKPSVAKNAMTRPTVKPVMKPAVVKSKVTPAMRLTLKPTVKPTLPTPVTPSAGRRQVCCPNPFQGTQIDYGSSATASSVSGNTNGGNNNFNGGGSNNRNGDSSNGGGTRGGSAESLLPNTRTCGIQSNDRIVGGTQTDIDEHPWMALLRYDKPVGWGFYCGGVLISSRYVLTAAHCVKGQDLPTNWRLSQVRLGEWNTSSTTDCVMDDCATPVQDVAVENTIAHEQYNPQDSNQHNDIALLRLARPVHFNDFVKPICLPLSSEMKNAGFDGYKMEVAGWGKTETRSESEVKLKVTVPVVNRNQCATTFNRVGRSIWNKQLCAGGAQGQDSCRGDSGGALMGRIPSADNWFAFGVVSYGPSPCGTPGWPGVYTRVGAYVDWILSKIRP